MGRIRLFGYEGYVGVVKGGEEGSPIQNIEHNLRYGVAYNILVVLKEEWVYPVWTRRLVGVHLHHCCMDFLSTVWREKCSLHGTIDVRLHMLPDVIDG